MKKRLRRRDIRLPRPGIRAKQDARRKIPVADSRAIRVATPNDVPRLLEIGEKKRRLYETFSPIFWRVSATPRTEFALYMTQLVEAADNIALVAEVSGYVTGYCIVQKAKEPGGAYLDDFTVENQEEWASDGVALLSHAARRASERELTSFVIVCGHADAPKRAALESLGFSRYQNWWVQPLR